MKKRNILISSLVLLGFILIPLNLDAKENNSFEKQNTKESRAAGIFDVEDDKLQKAIVEQVNDATGSSWDLDNMPEDELLKITYISSGENIDTLGGLDYYIKKGLLSNVDDLSLYSDGNNISDISPLEGWTSLEYLDVSANINDISVLSSLSGLKEISLKNGQISDISVLSNMTQLKKIDLSNNQISDISPLESLTNLKTLSIKNNNISDISALSNSVNMEYLHVENNQISDISAVKDMSQLKEFYGTNNLIEDVSPMLNKPSLYSVYLEGNKIYDLSPLESASFVMADDQNIEIDLGVFDDIEDIKLLSGEVSIFLTDGTEVKIPYGLDINDIVGYDDYSYTVPFNQDTSTVSFNGNITATFSYVAPIPLTPLDPSIPTSVDPSDPITPTDPNNPIDAGNPSNKNEIPKAENGVKKLIQTGKKNVFTIASFIVLLISLRIVILNKRV